MVGAAGAPVEAHSSAGAGTHIVVASSPAAVGDVHSSSGAGTHILVSSPPGAVGVDARKDAGAATLATQRMGADKSIAKHPASAGSASAEAAIAASDREARLERIGDRIAELAARIQAAIYEFLVLIRDLDAEGGWKGFSSTAQWLSWRTGYSPGVAREYVRVARALGELPKLSDAMRRGRISYSKVRAVTRVATSENEETLLGVALSGTAAHVEQIVRAWRRIDASAERAEERRRDESRSLTTFVDHDGMVVVRGRLTPEVGAVLRRALEAAVDQARRAPVTDDGATEGSASATGAVAGDARAAARDAAAGDGAAAKPTEAMEPTLAMRQADAIGAIAEAALSGGLDRGTAGDRYQVVLHVDAPALAERRDVPAGTSGAADPGPNPGDGGNRVPAETSGETSAPESTPAADVARVPAAAFRSATPGSEPHPDGDRVPAGTSEETTVPTSLAQADHVSAITSGDAKAGWPSDAAGERDPAGASGVTDGLAALEGNRVSAGTCGCTAAGALDTDADRVPAGTSPGTAAVASASALAQDGGSQTVLDEAGGIHVSAETARRIACDAATVTIQHGPDGSILDVGRRTRTISPALRRALAARDRRCRFPGCGNRRCDAHHVQHWADGGPTALDNLVLLCRRHHRAVHEEGYRITLDAAGGVQFHEPNGRVRPDAPSAPTWAGPALKPVNDALDAAGIVIDAATATPAWRGERLDLGYAMDVLWRRRCEPQPE